MMMRQVVKSAKTITSAAKLLHCLPGDLLGIKGKPFILVADLPRQGTTSVLIFSWNFNSGRLVTGNNLPPGRRKAEGGSCQLPSKVTLSTRADGHPPTMGFPVVQVTPPTRWSVLAAVAEPRSGHFSAWRYGHFARLADQAEKDRRFPRGKKLAGASRLSTWASGGPLGLFVILQFPPRRPRDPSRSGLCFFFSLKEGRRGDAIVEQILTVALRRSASTDPHL